MGETHGGRDEGQTGPKWAERFEGTAFNPLRVEGKIVGIAFRGFAPTATQVEPLRGLLPALPKPEQVFILPVYSLPSTVYCLLAPCLALDLNPTRIIRHAGCFSHAIVAPTWIFRSMG